MAKESAVAQPRIELERSQFRRLIASNPNYFGNLEGSALKAAAKISQNSKYEQLTCLGYNPDSQQLEAVAEIKLPFGYGGNLCQKGSTEYVRFWVDYGSGWKDAGLVAFAVHDIPNGTDCAKNPDKPLTYAASLRLEPPQWCCDTPLLPRVRAILSWELVPPNFPGAENWKPIWGSVLEEHIQIKPLTKWWCLLESIGANIWDKLDLKPYVAKEILKPIPLPDPPPLELSELLKLYGPSTSTKAAQTAVEPHRFGFSQLNAALTNNLDTQVLSSNIAQWKELGLNWAGALEALDKTKGNVSYEELDCLALDTNREWLVATFVVKKPSGYSGNLCSKGSLENIAFWADWHDTCEWSYLGTVQVSVHDISKIPAGGLHYAALLKVKLDADRRPCDKTRPSRIRAVLSWATPPSTTDPDAIPYWGNRLDAHVVIRPGEPIIQPTAIIRSLGSIPIGKIDPGSGLTTPSAFFEFNNLPPDSLGRPCPFGGRVVVKGPSFPGLYYRVQVKRDSDPPINYTPVKTNMLLEDSTGTIFTTWSPVNADGFFAYANPNLNAEDLLALWDTTGDELWDVLLEVATAPNSASIVATVMHRIQLDNTWPQVDIHIDTVDGIPVGIADCKDFLVGVKLAGRFVARDTYFGSYGLGTLPFAAPAGQLVPTSGNIQTAPAPGDVWKLDTKGMKECGYVLEVSAVDRAILNSGSVGHYSSTSVGFCLRSPAKK